MSTQVGSVLPRKERAGSPDEAGWRVSTGRGAQLGGERGQTGPGGGGYWGTAPARPTTTPRQWKSLSSGTERLGGRAGGGGTTERGGGAAGRSEPGLRLGDVDLDALGALGGRVLADGRGALGGHQALAGLLALRALQRALPDQRRGALRRLLWHWRRGPSLLIKAEGSGHYTASQDKLGKNWDRSAVRTRTLFFFKPKGG